MCLSDLLLGRLTQTGTGRRELTGGEPFEVVPPDPSRIALMIGGYSVNVDVGLIAWSPPGGDPEEQSDAGFDIRRTPLILDARSHGEVVTRRWVVKSILGESQVRWVTVSLKPELAPLFTDLLRKTLGSPDLPGYPGAMAPRPVFAGSDLMGGIP